jgi:predicted Fe-S protein YdhL (DUF1289 family)
MPANVRGGPVPSPCISVCIVDPRGSGLCIGCGRTLDEIASWIDLSDEERRRVIDALGARLEGLAKRAAAEPIR